MNELESKLLIYILQDNKLRGLHFGRGTRAYSENDIKLIMDKFEIDRQEVFDAIDKLFDKDLIMEDISISVNYGTLRELLNE
jgi:chloramphenicol 3-O-phosphotransferase